MRGSIPIASAAPTHQPPDFGRAANGDAAAGERERNAIAHGLDETAAVGGHSGIDEREMRHPEARAGDGGCADGA